MQRWTIELSLARCRALQSLPGLEWLRPGEQRRLATFSSPSRRQQFVAGRWLLREVLAAEFGGAPEAQVAEIDAEGRSHVAHGYANLSHSGDWCVAVWSSLAPVGVDLEVLRPRNDLLGMAERVASAAECERLTAMAEEPARLQAFYRLWTLKEAWLKSRGQGLDLALMRGLEFEHSDAGADAASVHLPLANLQLSLCGMGLRGLPDRLADEPLSWQHFRQLTL